MMETAGTLLVSSRGEWARCELLAPTRRALMLDLYRMVVSVGLCAYFVRLFIELPGLVGSDGLLSLHTRLANIAVHASSLRCACALGAVFAITLLLGITPRASAAALWCLSIGLSRVTADISTLDEPLVSLAAFWLCMLPTGRALSIERLRAAYAAQSGGIRGRGVWQAVCELRVDGYSASMCGLHIAFLQLDTALWRNYAPHWPAAPAANLIGSGLVLALFAPRAQLRAIAALGIAALHAGLWLVGHTDLQFAHLLFLASPLLLWSACETHERVVPAWNAASAIGALMLALTLSARFAVVPVVAASSARLLHDAGLLPIASGRKDPDPFVLWLHSDRGPKRRLDSNDVERSARGRRALGYLADVRSAQRDSVARVLAARACATLGSPRESGMLELERALELTRLAWIDCGLTSDAPNVVMLDGKAQE